VNCLIGRTLHVSKIREHLLSDEFLRSYTTWTCHGELLPLSSVCQTEEFVYSTIYDKLEDIIRDIGVQAFVEALVYENMFFYVETTLYLGSINFTQLLAMLRLMNLKKMNG